MSNNLLEIAKKLSKAKVSTIFVNDKKVANYRWEKFTKEVPTEQELEYYYYNNPSAKGIGLILGQVSNNLICFDFDSEKSYELFKNFLDDDTYELFNKTRISKTRRGYHVFFKIKEQDVVIKSRRFQNSKIELRAEKNYVIIPPSVINGYEYKYINKNNILEIPHSSLSSIVNYIENFDKKYDFYDTINTIINESSGVYQEGNRDIFIFGLSGLMKKLSIDKKYAKEIVEYICDYFQDEEKKYRLIVLDRTYSEPDNDKISGYDTLSKLFLEQRHKLDTIVDSLSRYSELIVVDKKCSKPVDKNNAEKDVNVIYEKLGFKSNPVKIVKYTTNPAIYEIEFEDGGKIKFKNAKALFDKNEFMIKYFEIYDDIVIINKDDYKIILSWLVRNTLQYKEITQQDYGDIIFDIVENLISESREGYEHYKTSFIDCQNDVYAFSYPLLERHLDVNNCKLPQQEVLKILSTKFEIKNDSRKVGKSGKSVRFYFIKRLESTKEPTNLLETPKDSDYNTEINENN